MRKKTVKGRPGRFGAVYADDFDTPRFRLLSPVQRCIFVALTTYAGRFTDECWPSEERLASIVGVHRVTVSKAIARLEELGYLSIVVEQTGHWRHNRYTLLSPPAAPLPPALPGDPSDSHGADDGGVPVDRLPETTSPGE